MRHFHVPLIQLLFVACLIGGLAAKPVAGQSQDFAVTEAARLATAASSDAQAGNLFDIKPVKQGINPNAVKVSQAGLIDLDLKDQDITQVLNMLSLQAQRNIIASPNVSGTISGRVYGADFYEVLDGLLTPYGLTYREKGNFIHVYTLEEMQAREKATRKLVTKVIRLNYLTATEAATLLTPMLSPAGSITGSAEAQAGFDANTGDGGANTSAHGEVLIVRDVAENLKQILSVVKELDIRPEQVLIEATILSASLKEDNQLGVDLTAVADLAFSQITGGPAQAVAKLLDGTVTGSANVFQTDVGGVSRSGGTKVGILTGDIAAFVRALDEVVDTTILSHPKLLVLNRQRAILQIVDRLGYISSTTTETSSTTTVEFLDVGTTLRVRPFVSNDGFIRLELQPEVSDGQTTVQAGQIIPNESTQNLITNVMVRNGNTVILGGLFKEQTIVGRKQTPFLGDIPIVGAAFRGQDDQVRRSETMFLITPTVVKDQSLYAAGEQMNDSIRHAQMGARQGLLPFSRSRLVAGHMRDALKAYQQNQNDKALMSVDMALRLNPTYVQAQRLRDKITARVQAPVQRSLLDEAVQNLIRKELKQGARKSEKSEAQSAVTPGATSRGTPGMTPGMNWGDTPGDTSGAKSRLSSANSTFRQEVHP